MDAGEWIEEFATLCDANATDKSLSQTLQMLRVMVMVMTMAIMMMVVVWLPVFLNLTTHGSWSNINKYKHMFIVMSITSRVALVKDCCSALWGVFLVKEVRVRGSRVFWAACSRI